jgi:hypothetical protein
MGEAKNDRTSRDYRQRYLAVYKRGLYCINTFLSWMGGQGYQETVRQGAGTGDDFGSGNREDRRVGTPVEQTGKNMMTLAITTGRSIQKWALIAACVVLFLANLFPIIGIELYPVLDIKDGNLSAIEVSRRNREYRCGEMVVGQFIFQKQRAVAGSIKWELVESPINTKSKVILYPARVAACPTGFINHFANIERLPEICSPGWYQFRGTISYPLLFGTATYQLKTVPFEVVP